MALYQKAVLERYIKALDKKLIQEKYETFKAHFHNPTIQENIKKSKEEQYQEGFLTDLFVNIFGYTKNPNEGYNLTTELKNVKDAKKADGAIIIDDKVIAIVELKGMSTTNLDSIENQAFNYKNNQVDCNYVITSNFQKIRLYIDNAVTHQEWDLFTLTEEQFQELYISLAFENIKSDLPKTIKDKSLSEQDTITKKLYKDYSNFKKELYQDLVKNNPDIDQLTLFKKAQKLLDRFLFLFFAEDRGLLQPQSVRTIVKRWNQAKDLDLYHPLMDSYRKYFGYLNDGYQSKDLVVYAYNGGLFAPDDILDKVIVSDDVLEINTLKISDYDFESEVDVNILRHIFENSLNELEEVEAEIRGEAVEKTKTKRKKDGVFYTPKYITKYIVDNTVGKLCQEKKEELQINEEDYTHDGGTKLTKRRKDEKKQALDKLETYRTWLLQITICDPACGSGAFLNQALEFLIEEHAYIDELQAKLFGDALVLTDIEGSILENNLYGVDINEESIEIAKLSLWLRTAEPNRKLTSLSNNLKSGNSLIDDPAIAGDKAFNWEQEFPHVFAKGGFDVIIGNPPYVNAKGNNFTEIEKTFYYDNYKTAVYQIDTYILFIEKSKSILKDNCLASYIVPNAWLNNLLLADVRKFILEEFQLLEIVNAPSGVFADATVDTIIFNIRKNNERHKEVKLSLIDGTEIIEFNTINQNVFYTNTNYNINIYSTKIVENIIKKIESNYFRLNDLAKIGRGVGVYHKRVGHTKEFIAQDPYQSSRKVDESFVPYLRGKNINHYLFNWNNDSFISYGNWLAEPREKLFFEGDRIVLRQIPGKNNLLATLIKDDYIIDQSVFIARFCNESFNPLYVQSIIASKLIFFYFKNKYSEFDDLFPKVKLQHFKDFPIKNISLEAQQPFIEMADKMLALNKEVQSTSHKFSKLLASELGLTEPSKKLQEWYNLEFTDFAKELKKKKIELSLAQKAEWMDFFESEKQKVNQTQAEIQTTDKQIDQMVYDLYELTPEEIQIVENA